MQKRKDMESEITRRAFLEGSLVAGGLMATGLSILPGRKLYAQPKAVKVGQLAPLTGVSASWGQRSYWGFLLAADALNKEGGIQSMGGAKIEIVVADTESKPEVAGIQAEKLIADRDIIMLTGTNQSAAGMVATQVAERSRICYVTGIDGAPQITQRGFQYTYRTCPIMTDYARDLVYFARDMGKKTGKEVKKMAILCENSIFGVSGGDAAEKFGKEVGFDIVDYSTYDAASTRDFTGYISKYKSAGVDLLVCHSRPQDGVLITRTMKELNFNPLGYGGMYGTHAIYDFVEALGQDSNYTLATTNFTAEADIPGLARFVKEYKERYKVEADANMLAGFAVLPVLKQTLEAKGTYDREEYKQQIDKVDLKAGQYYNLQIEGIKWDEKHDNALAQSFVIQWKDGVQYPVSPDKYAVRKPVWPRPTWEEISKGA
jgi:branched-chain amino acid transport system substrate-binding protein